MAINGSSINNEAINATEVSAGTVVTETISENLLVDNTTSPISSLKEIAAELISILETSTDTPYYSVSDSIVFNSTLSSLLSDILLVESLILSSDSVTTASFKELVLEKISLVDELIGLLTVSVTDSIVLVNTISALLNNLVEVIDLINLSPDSSSKANFISVVNSTINLINSIDLSAYEEVIDSIIINNSISAIYSALASLVDSIVITDLANPTSVYTLSLSNSLSLGSSLSSTAILNNLVNDNLLFFIKDTAEDKFSTYLFYPETSAISTYNNYNFVCATKFGDKYLFGNKAGLYEYGAVKDGELGEGSTTPVMNLELTAMDFGTTNLKIVPQMYLGVSSTEQVILKVRVDGKAEVHYQLNKHTNNLQTQKVDIGKGLVGRYFQFELVTSADTFNLESIDFYPVELKRKI